ncbi:MAG: chemotaxis protein CheA [Deltaproteobacteria bacterium]|nr:chemotaxis protein CheA [Deltaproteobacteria bacterium]
MADEDKIDLSIFLNEYLSDAAVGFQKASDALLALEKDRGRVEKLDEVARVFHTLKSSSAMLGFDDIAGLAHCAEDILVKLKGNQISVSQGVIDILFETADTLERMVTERGEKVVSDWGARITELMEKIKTAGTAQSEAAAPVIIPAPPPIEKIETVRVHIGLLDELFNQVGELLIAKNRLDTILRGTGGKELREVLATIARTVNAIQENVTAARLVPVDEIFQKFPRMVRDLAREQRKEVDLIMEGREIELDKSVLDAISEPLMHLLRNAVGHGIESPTEREAQGKGKRGTLKLTTKRAENHILMDVEDDGRGIDLGRMRETAVMKGFIKPEEAELISDADVMKVLFSPGFSSVEYVTNLSGRGIGLNVVKIAARELGGTVDVVTQRGKGTRFSMMLPLTTAIVQTLLVEVGGHVFAIPSEIVLETMRIAASDIKEVADRRIFVRGTEVISFFLMNDILGMGGRHGKEHDVVIVHMGGKFIGLGVDGVVGQMDNIIKPFDPIAQEFKGFSGGTILGDGRVALLLDVAAMFGFETLRKERYSV